MRQTSLFFDLTFYYKSITATNVEKMKQHVTERKHCTKKNEYSREETGTKFKYCTGCND